MQMVCQPRGTTAASYLSGSQDGETVRYFALDGALPVGQILVLNTQFATLSFISNGDERPRLVAQQQFTGSELSLLLPLLELYPHYCPYEVMFASFYNGAVTDEAVERCRRQLQEALEAGVWDQHDAPGAQCAIPRALQDAQLRHRHYLYPRNRLHLDDEAADRTDKACSQRIHRIDASSAKHTLLPQNVGFAFLMNFPCLIPV